MGKIVIDAPLSTIKFKDTSPIFSATSNNGKSEVAALTFLSSFPKAEKWLIKIKMTLASSP